MVNGIAYTCSVAATNSAGTGPASGTVMVTPTSANGAALWASVCTACHAVTPSGNQLNGAGSTATVLTHVRSIQPLMLFNSNVQALSPAELAAIAAYIGSVIPANQVNTAANTPAPINVAGHITFTNQSWSAFTSVEVVTAPVNGMLTAFTGTTATYTPNPGFSGSDTFTYRGKRTAPDVLGDPVQVTVTVQPGAPGITSPGTANGTFGQAFNYQIVAGGSPTSYGATGLPASLSVDIVTGAITGTAQVAGTFNATMFATNDGGTTTVPLVITIAKAAQLITLGTQTPSTRVFAPGGSFAINPLATGGASGNVVVYSSITATVCTVSSATVNMVAAGTCTLAANQAGDANYAAATQVTQSVAITAVAPGAPTINSATPGNAQAQIAFTAPAQNGGSAIIDYTVTCTASGQTTRTATAGSSPIIVAALVNAVAYDCSVTARNVAGNGPASVPVSVTPQAITVPDAPVIGPATAGDGSASIAFTAPVNNGGATISQYTAACSPGGVTGSNAASPVTVNGLTNGVTYTCSVTATNSAGTGPASATVDVTPVAVLLVAVQSRKTHSAVGDFDLQIVDPAEPITGLVTVEPRSIGAGHRIVFQFDSSVTSVTSVASTNTLGNPIGTATPSILNNELTVTLTGIPDNTRVKITVTGVNGTINTSTSVGFLVGDVNSSRAVNASDIAAVKARNGSAINLGNNYLYDLNANGSINAVDVSAVKARSGLILP